MRELNTDSRIGPEWAGTGAWNGVAAGTRPLAETMYCSVSAVFQVPAFSYVDTGTDGNRLPRDRFASQGLSHVGNAGTLRPATCPRRKMKGAGHTTGAPDPGYRRPGAGIRRLPN
jgi:hypothetical protein